MPAMPKPESKNGAKTPAGKLTQRLAFLESRLDAKHAAIDAADESAVRAVRGLKDCSSTSRTRMSIRAFSEEDLEPSSEEELVEDQEVAQP